MVARSQGGTHLETITNAHFNRIALSAKLSARIAAEIQSQLSIGASYVTQHDDGSVELESVHVDAFALLGPIQRILLEELP